jgi:hypothetical protein
MLEVNEFDFVIAGLNPIRMKGAIGGNRKHGHATVAFLPFQDRIKRSSKTKSG